MMNRYTSTRGFCSTMVFPPIRSGKHALVIVVYLPADDDPGDRPISVYDLLPDSSTDPFAHLLENLPEPNLSPAVTTCVEQVPPINPVVVDAPASPGGLAPSWSAKRRFRSGSSPRIADGSHRQPRRSAHCHHGQSRHAMGPGQTIHGIRVGNGAEVTRRRWREPMPSA